MLWLVRQRLPRSSETGKYVFAYDKQTLARHPCKHVSPSIYSEPTEVPESCSTADPLRHGPAPGGRMLTVGLQYCGPPGSPARHTDTCVFVLAGSAQCVLLQSPVIDMSHACFPLPTPCNHVSPYCPPLALSRVTRCATKCPTPPQAGTYHIT